MLTPDILDKEMSFAPYRHDNPLKAVFPLNGRGIKYVTLSTESDWLLVQLSHSFKLEHVSIGYALVKRNDKQPIVLKRDNQLVKFKPVPDVNLLHDGINDTTDFPLEIWALCK